jgi:hypothetical protein
MLFLPYSFSQIVIELAMIELERTWLLSLRGATKKCSAIFKPTWWGKAEGG